MPTLADLAENVKRQAAQDPERTYRAAGYTHPLKRDGRNLAGLCPLHAEKTPSFKIALTDPRAGCWKCFGCGAGGDVIALRQALTGETYPQAVEALGQALGVGKPETARRKPRGAERRTTYRITDPQTGEVVAAHVRVEYPDDPDPDTGKPRKRFIWQRDGNDNLGGLPVTALPLYRPPALSDPPAGSTVFLCEGERDAEALAERGLTAWATATGAETIPCEKVLATLTPFDVVLWPDSDAPGQKHMAQIAAALTALGVRPRVLLWPDAPAGGGAADWPGTTEELLTLAAQALPWRPPPDPRIRLKTAAEIQSTEYPPLRWAVPGLLPEGLTLLAGRPKVGKSYLALQIACAVATGGEVLGEKPEPGRVLYLALEDSERRLQRRMSEQYWPAIHECTFATTWPLFAEGGLDALAQELRAHDYALAVLDTLGRLMGAQDSNDYGAMTQFVGAVQNLAQATQTAILAVHHHTKAATGDPVLDLLGSTGISGTADGILALYHEPGKHTWKLHLIGREVEEQEIAVTRDAYTHTWQPAEAAGVLTEDGLRPGTLQQQVVEALRQIGGGATQREIAVQVEAMTGKRPDKGNLYRRLGELLEKGAVVKMAGAEGEFIYALPS